MDMLGEQTHCLDFEREPFLNVHPGASKYFSNISAVEEWQAIVCDHSEKECTAFDIGTTIVGHV